MWRGHFFIELELLRHNLFEMLARTRYRGVSIHLVKKISKQILAALLCLREMGLIHGDIKPENVVLKDLHKATVKLIDFGSCIKDDRLESEECDAQPRSGSGQFTSLRHCIGSGCYIQSRYYRAPEVSLGLPFDAAIDVWSLGAVMVEMVIATPMFDGRSIVDQLVKTESWLGPLPKAMVRRIPRNHRFSWAEVERARHRPEDLGAWFDGMFEPNSEPLGAENGPSPMEDGPSPVNWNACFVSKLKQLVAERQGGANEPKVEDFCDVIWRMLRYNPSERITVFEALRHPFFL
jgi:serine/threonine protein kinase